MSQPLQQRIIEKVMSYRGPEKSQLKYECCLKHTNKPVLVFIISLLNYEVTVFLFLLLFSSAVLMCLGHSIICISAWCCSQHQVVGRKMEEKVSRNLCTLVLWSGSTESPAVPRLTFQLSLPGLGQWQVWVLGRARRMCAFLVSEIGSRRGGLHSSAVRRQLSLRTGSSFLWGGSFQQQFNVWL